MKTVQNKYKPDAVGFILDLVIKKVLKHTAPEIDLEWVLLPGAVTICSKNSYLFYGCFTRL